MTRIARHESPERKHRRAVERRTRWPLDRPAEWAQPRTAWPSVRHRPPADLMFAYRLARYAAWALPAYAVVLVWWSARPTPDPMTDPVGWAQWVSTDGYPGLQALLGLGGTLLGLIAVLAVGVLLFTTRGRAVAAVALLIALVTATLGFARQGMAVFAAPVFGEQVHAGNPAAAASYHRAVAPADAVLSGEAFSAPALLLLVGTALVTLGWLVIGLAVWRSRVFARGDAVLLWLAAPLVGVVSIFLPPAAPLGGLLLLAAGVGIAWNGGRLAGLAHAR